MTERAPRPEVKAFLVCDQILHDAPTGKRSLIGVFHHLGAARFPAAHPALALYANLTDAHGRYELEFRLSDVERNAIIASAKPPPLEIADPRQVAEMSCTLGNLRFPAPGTYEFQLLANGELLATKAIRVFAVERRAGPGGGGPPGPISPSS